MPWPFDTTRVVEAAPALEFVLPPAPRPDARVQGDCDHLALPRVLRVPFSHLSQNKALGDDSNVLAVVVIGMSIAVGSAFSATCTTCGLDPSSTVGASLALVAAVVLVFSWTGLAARSTPYGADPRALTPARPRLQELRTEISRLSGIGDLTGSRKLEAYERAVADYSEWSGRANFIVMRSRSRPRPAARGHEAVEVDDDHRGVVHALEAALLDVRALGDGEQRVGAS